MISVYCFPNGNVAVTDESGKQVLEAQEPWILGIASSLEQAGLEPLDARITLPDGRHARFFRTDAGTLNWEVFT